MNAQRAGEPADLTLGEPARQARYRAHCNLTLQVTGRS
jgi:hypothetical protein